MQKYKVFLNNIKNHQLFFIIWWETMLKQEGICFRVISNSSTTSFVKFHHDAVVGSILTSRQIATFNDKLL